MNVFLNYINKKEMFNIDLFNDIIKLLIRR